MRKFIALVAFFAVSFALVGCGSSSGSDGDKKTTKTKAESTKKATTTTKPKGSGSDYESAIVLGFTKGATDEGNLVLKASQAECVAPIWVKTITADRFGEAGASPDLVAKPGFDYSVLELSDEDTQELINAFETCDVDIYTKIIKILTAGLTEEQQNCALKEFDEGLVNDLLLTVFSQTGGGETERAAVTGQFAEACDLPAA